MPRKISLLLLTITLMASAVMGGEWKEEDRFVERGVLGVGYDDGAAARVYILDDVSAYVSIGYHMTQGEIARYDSTRNNLSMISLKLGGEYRIKDLGRFRLNGFGEYKEIVQQGEASVSNGTIDAGNGDLIPNTGYIFRRYNQNKRSISLGVRPEFFITQHISIDYKMGWQWSFVGDTYSDNGRGGLTSNEDSYAEVGFYSTSVGDAAAHSPISSMFFNFGITFYISDLF